MGARKKAKPTARLRLEPLGLHIPRPGTVGPEHSVSDKKTLTCSDPAPHGWAGLGVELPQGQRARGPKASCSEPGTGSLPMCPLCPQMPLPGGICASTKPWSSLRTRSRWVGPACGGWARARLRGPGDWAMAAPMVPLPFAILGPRLRLANRVGHVTIMAWPLVTVSLSPC